jgi:hypothetical protein
MSQSTVRLTPAENQVILTVLNIIKQADIAAVC